MENDLLCLIGEAVLLEVHGIKDVSYPMDEENACIVVTDENKRYKLTLEKKSAAHVICAFGFLSSLIAFIYFIKYCLRFRSKNRK